MGLVKGNSRSTISTECDYQTTILVLNDHSLRTNPKQIICIESSESHVESSIKLARDDEDLKVQTIKAIVKKISSPIPGKHCSKS